MGRPERSLQTIPVPLGGRLPLLCWDRVAARRRRRRLLLGGALAVLAAGELLGAALVGLSRAEPSSYLQGDAVRGPGMVLHLVAAADGVRLYRGGASLALALDNRGVGRAAAAWRGEGGGWHARCTTTAVPGGLLGTCSYVHGTATVRCIDGWTAVERSWRRHCDDGSSLSVGVPAGAAPVPLALLDPQAMR